jgi:hypothetical protein
MPEMAGAQKPENSSPSVKQDRGNLDSLLPHGILSASRRLPQRNLFAKFATAKP